MSDSHAGTVVAGVDGCPAGWIAVLREVGAPARHSLCFFPTFAEVLAAPSAIVAVDMPIGLPARAGPGGRGPERMVRAVLGARQSSVFSVPSRAAVGCLDYRTACAAALASSDPPRKVSRQAFGLFAKIREIDALMTPALEARVFEVHPELGFWRLNGEAMSLPKKIRSRGSLPGIEQRRALLSRFGFSDAFWAQPRPRGVGADDLVDAAVNAVVAERILRRQAQPFPPEPECDETGLRMAIWA